MKLFKKPSPKEILPESFEKLYEDNLNKIYGFFYLKSLDKVIAEDLTSQTFISYFEKSLDTEIVISNQTKYLYGIMHNIWLSYLREKYKLQEQLVENIDDFTAYVEQEVETAKSTPLEVRALYYIEMLPPKQRQILKLRLIDKYSLGEICKILDKDMNYVKTTQQRGLNKLRQLVDSQPSAPVLIAKEKI